MAGLKLRMKMVDGESVVCPHCNGKSVTVIDSVHGPRFFCNKCFFHIDINLVVIEVYQSEEFKHRVRSIEGKYFANG